MRIAVSLVVMVLVGLSLTNAAPAQGTAKPTPKPTPSAAQPQTTGNAKVIDLVKKGVEESVIIAFVNGYRDKFDVEIEDIATLAKAGVSTPIIKAMKAKTSLSQTPQAEAKQSVASSPSVTPSQGAGEPPQTTDNKPTNIFQRIGGAIKGAGTGAASGAKGTGTDDKPANAAQATQASQQKAVTQSGQLAFADAWKDKHVVLVRELYTIHFVAEGGLGTSPKQYNEPLVFVSPNQIVYRVSVNGKEMFDDDVDRLTGQVTTKVQSRSTLQKGMGGDANSQMKTGAVELSKYKVGEEFVVTKVGFSKTDVQFALAKPFDLKTIATGFVIRLDGLVSKDLAERPLIETLTAKVVKAK